MSDIESKLVEIDRIISNSKSAWYKLNAEEKKKLIECFRKVYDVVNNAQLPIDGMENDIDALLQSCVEASNLMEYRNKKELDKILDSIEAEFGVRPPEKRAK